MSIAQKYRLIMKLLKIITQFLLIILITALKFDDISTFDSESAIVKVLRTKRSRTDEACLMMCVSLTTTTPKCSPDQKWIPRRGCKTLASNV